MPKVSLEYEQAQRERIIEGAAQSFADRGYRQTSIDEIARNLGLSKGAIYIYFKSKEELFVAIFAQFMSKTQMTLHDCITYQETVFSKLEKLLESYLSSLYDTDPVRSRLLLEFWLESSRLPELQKILTEQKKHDQEMLSKVLYQGVKSGELRANLNVEEVTEVILSTCDGLILSIVTGCSLLSREEIKRAVWNTFSYVTAGSNGRML